MQTHIVRYVADNVKDSRTGKKLTNVDDDENGKGGQSERTKNMRAIGTAAVVLAASVGAVGIPSETWIWVGYAVIIVVVGGFSALVRWRDRHQRRSKDA